MKRRDGNGLSWDQRNTMKKRLLRQCRGAPEGDQHCSRLGGLNHPRYYALTTHLRSEVIIEFSEKVPIGLPASYGGVPRLTMARQYLEWWEKVAGCALCGRLFHTGNARRIKRQMPNKFPRSRNYFADWDDICLRKPCQEMVRRAVECIGSDAAKAGVSLREIEPKRFRGVDKPNIASIMIRAALRAATTHTGATR